ncbi:MAG: hypothetical protein K0Q82_656 [Chryseobacterium indoltheticum]|jgi:hypothetical protein|nr:hypothetical protein [Chryseobacterium indoltheticum]
MAIQVYKVFCGQSLLRNLTDFRSQFFLKLVPRYGKLAYISIKGRVKKI